MLSPEMKATYGNLRFSLLMQELLSITLFIPLLSLGRYIFNGFSMKRFHIIYDACLKLYLNQIEDTIGEDSMYVKLDPYVTSGEQ